MKLKFSSKVKNHTKRPSICDGIINQNCFEYFYEVVYCVKFNEFCRIRQICLIFNLIVVALGCGLVNSCNALKNFQVYPYPVWGGRGYPLPLLGHPARNSINLAM